MARQKAAPATPPTLEPVKAIPALERLVTDGQKLRGEQWTSPRRQQFATTGEGLLLSALGSGHPSIQSFTASQCGSYGPGDTDGWLIQQANTQLDSMLAVLRSVIEQLRWQLPDPTQVFLPAGSGHDAYVEIRKVIQLATSKIFIVDTYVDETMWPLLKNLQPTTKIRILTMTMKGDFALEAKKFQGQHGNTIEVRQTVQYHDRFILMDTRCWHLGASIKDAGNKAFAMSEIVSPAICSAIRADVEAKWNAGTVVLI
jgi:hypothetical protein